MNFCFKNIKKSTACLCLFVYLLFGLLNTGGISFCLGNEHSQHFGVNVFGSESCCESKNMLVGNNILTANHESQSLNKHCTCNDVFIQASSVSQTTLSKPSLDGLFTSIKIMSVQLLAFCIDFNKIDIGFQNDTSHKIRDNCVSKLHTVILVI